jgi:hypothetical protein
MSKHFTAARTLSRKIENYLDGVLGYTGDNGIPMNTSTSADAFGRLRISDSFTIFDSQHRYADNGKWNNSIVGTASTTHLPNESAVRLNASQNGSIIRESNLVFPYQPGKSLLILNSFVFSASTVGVTQRIGYYNNQNGIYLQQDGHADGPALVLRSYVTGSTDNSRLVRRTSWNCDMFDGTGPSRRTLDLTKANIFWMDIEWLGVGAVRCGFVVDGKFHVAHTFFNDNLNSTSYMTTAVLPLRAELINTTNTSPFIKQICNSVLSEGGYQPKSIQHNKQSTSILNADLKSVTTAGTLYNAVSIRLNSTHLDGIVIPNEVNVLGESNKTYQWFLIKNPTLSGTPTFTQHPDCETVDYTVSVATVSGGNIVKTGYFTSNSGASTLANIGDLNFQLGRTQAGVSDVFTLAVTATANSSKFTANLGWYQIV